MTTIPRRAFVAGSITLILAPLAAGAQQTRKVPRVGFLVFTSSELRYRGFQQGLRELGYVEGQNIVIEFRSADGSLERLDDFARELVRLPVDVIVAGSTSGTDASKRATSTIPIVMANVTDPVGLGFVASLARPGGNVTGLTTISAELVGKRLELIREVIPRLQRVAVLWDEDSKANAIMLTRVRVAAPLPPRALAAPDRSLRGRIAIENGRLNCAPHLMTPRYHEGPAASC